MVKAVFSTQIANTNVIMNISIHSAWAYKIFKRVITGHNGLWGETIAYRTFMVGIPLKLPACKAKAQIWILEKGIVKSEVNGLD